MISLNGIIDTVVPFSLTIINHYSSLAQVFQNPFAVRQTPLSGLTY